MDFIFRTMIRDGHAPAIGPTGKTLGVRIPPTEPSDIPVSVAGYVSPNTGGMSVVPDWRHLLAYQIPKRLRHIVPRATGKDTLACWRLGESQFAEDTVAEGLFLRVDSPKHGIIEPLEEVGVDTYQADLAATRDRWVIDES
jgi:hypothetical protein